MLGPLQSHGHNHREEIIFFHCLKPIAKHPCSMQWQCEIQNAQHCGIPFLLCCRRSRNLKLFPNLCNAKPSYPKSIPALAASSLHSHCHCQERFTLCVKVSCSQMFYPPCSSYPSQAGITPSSTER